MRAMKAVVAAVAAAVVTTMVPGPAAAAAKPGADRPWSGYAIRADGTAAGGWIGARKMSGKVVYRLDPTRSPRRATYRAVRSVRDLPGKRASLRETARAAYILSRYGTYRYAVQSAAVDIALDQLLVGGRYGLGGKVTSRRVRQTGEASKVRSFAAAMLKESRRQAGPPEMRLAVSDGAVGDTVRATVRIRGANGRPVAGAPVKMTYPGATTQAVRTDPAGTAVATFVATSAGRHNVVATVRGLPEWRLLVRFPNKAKASRVARAGVKARASVRATAVITVRPTLQITAPSQSMRTSPVPGRFTLSGGEPGTRAATVRLFGPFKTAASTTCKTDEAAVRSTTVTGDGRYSMPAITAPSAGFYTWSVAVAGDSVNEPVSGCGGVIAVRVQPAIRVSREQATIAAGALLKPFTTTSGLPNGLAYAGYANVRVYGPFADQDKVRCGEAKLRRRTNAKVNGNGKDLAEPVQLNAAGWYGLVAVLPAGTFSTSAASPCGAALSMVRVQ